ncbi:MAG: hypothetical protein KDJ38_11320 [Gammaproteobacteria bacterium]|nr:hypothetical protein [Gammaproteobacteria bacterium]
MFIILLKFSHNKSQAGRLMEAHNTWIQHGFDDGVFMMTGSLQDGAGGIVLAQAPSLEILQARVAEDPFVAEEVVSAEVIEVTPGRTNESLKFLLT